MMKVWDLHTGQLRRTLEGHTNFARGVAITADGRLVVSTSDDNTLKVWDLESGEI
jgi:WD40 repeat protein